MNNQITLKVNGMRCRVSKDEEEVFCRHYRHCDNCCGLKICECNNKLIITDHAQ